MSEVAAEWVALESLTPWADNPRSNDHAVQTVAESIRRFGWGAPIVARRADGRIIAGHTRWKAAQALGHTTVPVRFVDLDEGEASALALADNRTAELATWDDAKLEEVLRGLEGDGVGLEGIGWSAEQMADIFDVPDLGGGGEPEVLADEYHIDVKCTGERQQAELLERFAGEGLECRALIL